MNFPILNGPPGWLCNCSTKHEKIYIKSDSPEEATVELDCKCVKCMGFISQEYDIGPPVEVSHSFPVEKLEELGFVGIYKKS